MRLRLLGWIGFCLCLAAAGEAAAENFRIATFNLENYIDEPVENRRVKEPEAKAKVVESILAIKPDVLAVQEVGTTNALMELRAALSKGGLELPFWEYLTGSDTNIHQALLSRYPLMTRNPHTNENYLLNGRRHWVSRGFIEVEVEVNPRYKFTLFGVHLKSRLPSFVADEAEMREQEALLLRKIVEARLSANPSANLVVLGDFNDLRDSKPLRALIGRGKFGLFDTRPVERNGSGKLSEEPRSIAWTYYYGKEDTYSRIDYILVSPGMKREWLEKESYVLRLPQWGLASDHCPVTCAFEGEDLPK